MKIELRKTENTWQYQWRRTDSQYDKWQNIHQYRVKPSSMDQNFTHLYRLVMNHMLAGDVVTVEATIRNNEIIVEGFQ